MGLVSELIWKIKIKVEVRILGIGGSFEEEIEIVNLF